MVITTGFDLEASYAGPDYRCVVLKYLAGIWGHGKEETWIKKHWTSSVTWGSKLWA